MSLALLSVLLLRLFSTPSHSATFTVRNDCPYTVWAAAYPGGGQRLDHGQKWIFNVSQGTTMARIWGRTNCNFDASGRGHCQTGDCGGVLECKGWGAPPNTMVEYALSQVNKDYYDISLVDGFNIPIEFSPTNASLQDNCKPINCSSNVNAECPDELKAPGGCNNPCTVFKTAEYCCTGGPGTCSLTTYARYFVSKCPDAYSYPQDNPIMFPCPSGSTDYRVVFCPDSNRSSSKKLMKLVTIAVGSAISGLLICVTALSIIWKRRMKSQGLPSGMDDIDLPLYDFATVAVATNHFSETNKLGAGGFGSVYKGTLSSGQEVAVKRLSKYSGQGPDEFMNEVLLIAKLQHRNLVGLVGCCIEREERMLIYEYMPKKSLDYFIFDHDRSSSLAWKRRFDIILGIARGLLYLHRDSKLQVIHRDLKTSNILLDADLNPKISDFGLARIFQGDGTEAETRRIVGTHGYMSPEYASDGKFSVKSDVFSFGVLLLEIVSSKRNRGFQHPDHYHNLVGHAWILWTEGRAMELIDEFVRASFVESQVERCIQVGLLCAQNFPEHRPTMSSVVFMLANEGATLPPPKEPGFFIVRSLGSSDAYLVKEESNTENMVTITLPEGR